MSKSDFENNKKVEKMWNLCFTYNDIKKAYKKIKIGSFDANKRHLMRGSVHSSSRGLKWHKTNRVGSSRNEPRETVNAFDNGSQPTDANDAVTKIDTEQVIFNFQRLLFL